MTSYRWRYRRSPSYQRGFTLTEMMVVVAIFSVLAVVAMVSIGESRKAGELDAFARAIQRTVTVARRRALETDKRYLVHLQARSVAYCELPPDDQTRATCPYPPAAGLESQIFDSGSGAEVKEFARAADYDRDVVAAPPRLAIDKGTALYMLPNGSCDSNLATPLPEGFTAYLGATDKQNPQRRTVAVFPLTARSRITDRW